MNVSVVIGIDFPDLVKYAKRFLGGGAIVEVYKRLAVYGYPRLFAYS